MRSNRLRPAKTLTLPLHRGKRKLTRRPMDPTFRHLGEKGLWIERQILEWDFDLPYRKASFVRQLQEVNREGKEDLHREMKYLAWLRTLSGKQLIALYDHVFEPHCFYKKAIALPRERVQHRLWIYYLIIRSFHYKHQGLAKALRAWCLYLLQYKANVYEESLLVEVMRNPLAWNMKMIAWLSGRERLALLAANDHYMKPKEFWKLSEIDQCCLVAEVLFNTSAPKIKSTMLRTIIRECPDITYSEFLNKYGVYFTKKPSLLEFRDARHSILGDLDGLETYYWCDDICGQAREEALEVSYRGKRAIHNTESWGLLVARVSRAYRSRKEEYHGLRWLPKRTWDGKDGKAAREAYLHRLRISRRRREAELSQLTEVQEVWFHGVGDSSDGLFDS